MAKSIFNIQRIDVLPYNKLISIPPYRMSPPKLKELKEKLKELIFKGFIKPNMSQWGFSNVVHGKMILLECSLTIVS